MNLLDQLLLLIVAALTFGLINIFFNLIYVKKLESYTLCAETPFVSILVPARDEERNIETCVTSLLAQDYPNFEVLVLNDHSTDATPSILSKLAASNPRLRVIQGKTLPEGWPGKHWACQQLGEAARGEYLLFTDADTCHESHALSSAIAAACHENVDLVTAIPHEEVKTWSEKLIVPFMNAAMFGFLPLHLAYRHQIAAFSVTIGQFMLFRRSAYEEIGGYAAACENVNDDVILGRTLMQTGHRWIMLDGSGAVSCRMYHGLSEIIEGFSKNVFGFFDYAILPFTLIWSLAAYFLLEPLRILGSAILIGQIGALPARLALIAVVETFFLFLLAYHRLRIPFYVAFFYPLTVFLFVLTAFRSMVMTLTGRASWKGRTLKNADVKWL